jgi:hypothetical protein
MKNKTLNIGEKFNRLTILEKSEIYREKTNKIVKGYQCRCECGKEIFAVYSDITSGHTKSCGCYRSEVTRKKNFKHGKRDTAEYKVWLGIRFRCSGTPLALEVVPSYTGITCEWISFEKFLEDMGERPTSKHTIERINPEGNYCKENCKWVDDRSLQAFNQKKRKTNSSGRTGVYPQGNKWYSKIMKDGKQIYLGSFNSFEEAVKERETAEEKYYGFKKKN